MLASRAAYTTCMILATLLAGWLIRRRQAGLSLAFSEKLTIAIGGFIGATVAAKLPFVLGADSSSSVLAVWLSDGKTILWALVGGYVGVEVAKWSLYVRTSTGDTFVVPVALAVAVGRLGCFLYGCCHGIPTNQSWGVRFAVASDGGELLRHPAQLYEFAFHVAFALIAWVGISRHTAVGNWMPIYLVNYAAYRFISEWWREEADWLWQLTFYQCSALVIASAFSILLAYRSLRRPEPSGTA